MISGIVACILLFFGMKEFGDFLVWKYYLDAETSEQRIDDYIENFQSYVKKNKLTVSNKETLRRAIAEWSGGKSAYITLYIDDELIYSIDWLDFGDDTSGELDEIIDAGGIPNRDLSQYLTEEAKEKYEQMLTQITNENENLKPIQFLDGTALAVVYDYSADTVHNAVLTASALISIVVFLVIMMIYYTRVTTRITRLARDVRLVERGATNLPIQTVGNDEIASLATDIGRMRNAIVENANMERRAWETNAELITAMSHDIRTPLTVLIGYIDLMEIENRDSEMDEYIKVCKNNAQRLKKLSDDLFAYNLIYGGKDFAVECTDCNAIEVISGMISEHITLLEGSDFRFEIIGECPNVTISINQTYFGRVIGNIFTNISKYADAAAPVTVQFRQGADELCISFKNSIRHDITKAESSNIGNNTCVRIMQAMDGNFEYNMGTDEYCANVRLPIFVPEE